jgi:hypothetical protein
MNITNKKYKIVKNINQYAGYEIPKKYEPIINEIAIDIRIILLIIFGYKNIFNNVKAYFLKIFSDNMLIINLINDIKYETVHEQVKKKEDILPIIKNLLKILFKIYENSEKNENGIIKIDFEHIEKDINNLIVIFIDLIFFIIDVGIIVKSSKTIIMNFFKFNISGNINIFFNLDNFYKNFYPKKRKKKKNILIF